MPPDEIGNLTVLDLEWKDSEVVCKVQRYDPMAHPTPHAAAGHGMPLMVSWGATTCPSGYVPLAGGVAYVLRPPGYRASDYLAQPSERGARLSWAEPISENGLMLILVLPAGYVLPSVDDADPTLAGSKEFNGRMALYWLVRQNNDRRQEFSWRMEKVQYTTAELKTRCSLLNDEAAERRKQANEYLPSPVLVNTNPQSERHTMNSLLVLITHWTFIVGLVICLIGLAFVLVGSSGNTNFTLFGQSFASTNIGIAAIGLGVFMIVLNIGRILVIARRASRH